MDLKQYFGLSTCNLGRYLHFDCALCWFSLMHPQPQVSQFRPGPLH